MASLSEILKAKITKDGISKAYVASEMKVSERTIENYMNGVRNPKPEALAKLAGILGFSLSELENFEQDVPQGTKKKPPQETETVLIPRNYFELLVKNSSMLEKTTVANSESAMANRITAEALLAHVLQSLVVGLDEVDLSRVEKIAPELYSRALELVAKQKDKREGNLGSKK
jgi:transcriptional regulator with XRE-family HTH domain